MLSAIVIKSNGSCLWISNGIYIPNYYELLISVCYPCKEFAEQRKGRVCNYNISFITKSCHLITAEITVIIKILPMQIVYIYMSIACDVSV